MRRHGKIIRKLPHGTIMVWDLDARSAFPYYERRRRVEVGDFVTFELNDDKTVAVDLRSLIEK